MRAAIDGCGASARNNGTHFNIFSGIATAASSAHQIGKLVVPETFYTASFQRLLASIMSP
ncbi:MAG: hypothetical protein EAZ24_02210 [Burkholderiales bacterium]|nr:MAG: hypothetical protein EAZ21_09470 [Betaproteobacteria bacterium]TAG84001.1 MAG: hypothetical protein EAZ24_02210 [Burkholderiales bacterium]